LLIKKPPIFTNLIKNQPTYPLRLVMPNNARPNRIAETSGTDFSRDFLKIISLFYFYTGFYSCTVRSSTKLFQVKL